MALRALFTTHPAEVGESYFGHLRAALGIGLTLFWAGFACLLHAIFPFLCKRTGSRTINRLHQQIAARNQG
ncbi:DUF6356 family protein [Roseiterribacter gracilis]|uniref:Capsule biosynthesis protein n=1 Tax=Roseiterribacter gracilis TaxID=2812848 RepID=A0A8S8XC74_9PROT|nr:hypothetical protein TMPK1_10770 [Rhodospirillales bacterium TMPK1]